MHARHLQREKLLVSWPSIPSGTHGVCVHRNSFTYVTIYTVMHPPPPQCAGVIPYLPYSKQSKMIKRGCITTKLLASMLARAGMSHLLTMDLYSKEIQGFFDFPVDNLRGSPFIVQYIQENVRHY